MSLRKRAGNWHFRFIVSGKTYTGDTGWAATQRDRKPAEAIEAVAWRNIAQGKDAIRKVQAIKFQVAAEVFLADTRAKHAAKPNTSRRVETSFPSLCVFFGSRAVGSITVGDVVAFAAWRATGQEGIKPVKPVTIRHDLHSLSKFFRFAIKNDWCRTNPVLSEDIPSDAEAVRMNVLTPEQEAL